MTLPSKEVAHGVKRRRRADVPFTLSKPISIFKRPERSLGDYIVNAVEEAFREAGERKLLSNRLRAR